MKTTYEKCPHCGCDVSGHIRNVWDYQGEFDTYCPSCEKDFGVSVEAVPEFRCTQETNRERDIREHQRSLEQRGGSK